MTSAFRNIIVFLLLCLLLSACVCAAEPDAPLRAYHSAPIRPIPLADPADFPVVSVRYTPTADEIEDPNAFRIRVNRRANTVTVYRTDAGDGSEEPLFTMLCSVGRATPSGVYKTSVKYAWRPLFGSVYGQYSVRITGNILFHSVPYKSQSKDSLKYEEYNKLGTTASMGCVRLCCADAFWIYANCASGTVVEIYDDEEPGPFGKPELAPIDPLSPHRGWDPTDPDQTNPWLETEAYAPKENDSLPGILGIR